MFQAIFENTEKFGWWDLERISADACVQFTSTEFQDECQTGGVWITLAYPEHQEMNVQVKVIWILFRTITHSLMVHAQVLEAFMHLTVIYTEDHISGTTNQRLDKQRQQSDHNI